LCDIPQFRPGQDCAAQKVVAFSVCFESSPEYIKCDAWCHPDLITGTTFSMTSANSEISIHISYGHGKSGDIIKVPLSTIGSDVDILVRCAKECRLLHTHFIIHLERICLSEGMMAQLAASQYFS
jgi:hypothetical protein